MHALGMAGSLPCVVVNRLCSSAGWVKRTQRYPQYTDAELAKFFAEVSMGYCFEQAAERAGMDWQTMHNTLYGDDETMAHALDLSMVAGALIRRGDLPVPDRWDGLYKGKGNGTD